MQKVTDNKFSYRACHVCGCNNYKQYMHQDLDEDGIVFSCGLTVSGTTVVGRCRSGDQYLRRSVGFRDWLRGYVYVTIPKDIRKGG